HRRHPLRLAGPRPRARPRRGTGRYGHRRMALLHWPDGILARRRRARALGHRRGGPGHAMDLPLPHARQARSMTLTHRGFVFVYALVAVGCAEEFALPMTAAQFATHDSGPALVAYLGQSDASPAVCDLRNRGPHLSALDGQVRSALVRGLAD